jgi:RNA polymerase sigma-70 factor (ECF subfamily)
VRQIAALPGVNKVRQFVTTRWSLIRGSVSSESRDGSNEGLAQLCEIYWQPIFTFICSRGYSQADAQDLTQDFFISILKGTLLQTANPARGRFRSLLIKSLKNFLVDDQLRRKTQKRGGRLQFVSWDNSMVSAFYPSSASLHVSRDDPEILFDSNWAKAVGEEALLRLRIECEAKGRRRVYEVLYPHLASERGEICYQNLSAALGVTESSVKSLLHQFRIRYRVLLKEEVKKTVEKSVDIDDEIRYLCATLSACGG